MYCFQHADKGAVCPDDIPVLGHRRGILVAADPDSTSDRSPGG
jgi:hypothetical protein